jgi:Uma2 family endonuclease
LNANTTIHTTVQDLLSELGGLPASRVRICPAPGSATNDDLIFANESQGDLCELVEGCLVEKAMSFESSVVAATIVKFLSVFVDEHDLGLVSGPDGFFRLQSTTRGPDVAFVARDRLACGLFPTEIYPRISPNLVVEVLSPGNTKAEMDRKRIEYFDSGVQVVWIVDCSLRTVAVYTSPSSCEVLGGAESVEGGEVLPGFTTPVSKFFAKLDLGRSKP